MTRTFPLAPLWMAVLAASAGLASAQPGTPQQQGATIAVEVGAEHTDNAYKNEEFKRSEMKEYLNLDLGYLREGEVFLADVAYNGELANYEHNTTDDDSVYQGRSHVAWKALPGRLVFDASHERSEQIQDSRNPDIRNNRQLRDILSAGPQFTARMSPVDFLVFDGRWMDVSYDEEDRADTQRSQNSDSERLMGGLAWQHRKSKTDLWSLSYQYIDTEFDEFTDEFQYQRLFATYAVELRASGYSVSLGGNRSERDTGDNDGFYAQANWHLETGAHRFRVIAINQLTDSGIGLGGNSLTGGDFRPSDSNYDVIDTLERSSLDFTYGYSRLCERCDASVTLSYDDQDFETEPRDQEQLGARASFVYRLTSTLRATLSAGYGETDYPEDANGGRTDERTNYAASLGWQLSRSLSTRLWLSYDERDSDAATQGYDEFAGGVSLRYQFR